MGGWQVCLLVLAGVRVDEVRAETVVRACVGGAEFRDGVADVFVCGDEGETEMLHGVLKVGVGEAWILRDSDESAHDAERGDFFLRRGKQGLDD